jgi:PAS domain S-box-containing protein
VIGIYEIDLLKGIFLKVSQNVCEGLGYSPEELIGQSVGKVMTPESSAHFQERMNKMQHGEMLDGKVQYIAIARDGTRIPISIEAFYKISNGRIVGAIVAAEESKDG